MTTMTATMPSSTLLKEKNVSSLSTRNSSGTTEVHYKDWPNTIGFEADYEQHQPIKLNVTGTIPSWAAGTLYRTGPGTYKVTANNGNVVEAHHWFDGFSVVHRFQLHAPEDKTHNITSVSYNSRRTCDSTIQRIKETGKWEGLGFAQKRDPCQSYFKKIMSSFTAAVTKSAPPPDNVGVSLSINMPGMTKEATGIQSLTARTDSSRYLKINPETLEPAGLCDQTVLHPELKGPLSGTHAKTDPVTGDLYNYNLEFGPECTYRIFEVSKSTGETSILAKFAATPAYIHSILLTEHTVILCVWNAHITKNGLSIAWNNNILDSITPLNPKDKAYWYVIDRSPARRGLLATITTDAFFCFHTINAFEQPSSTNPGTVDIIADLSGYDDLSMLKSFYYHNMISTRATEKTLSARTYGTYRRYKLPSISLKPSKASPANKSRPGTIIYRATEDASVDLPTLHPSLFTHPYRYHYGVTDNGKSSFIDGLAKYDTKTNTAIHWRQHGHTPGEPIFVPHPDADPFKQDEEDNGVLLTVVCDGFRELSYLLVLNAKDLTEMGRAEMEVAGEGESKRVVGFGFHGIFASQGAKIAAGE